MVGDKRKETMGRETYAPGSYCNPGEATNIAAPSSRDTGTGNSAVFRQASRHDTFLTWGSGIWRR